MRIALMTNNYKPVMGGVPISIERLAVGLRAQGHEAVIFAPTYREQEEEEDVFRYATLLHRFVGGIVIPNPFDLRIEEEFRKRRFDVIHVHHPMLVGRTAAWLSRKYGIPLVFTYHTRYEKYVECYTGGLVRAEKLMPLYLKPFFRRCSYIFAPTEGIRRYLTDTCGVERDRTGILPTGIEERSFRVTEEEKQAVRRQYQAEELPMFLTVSRMGPEKNVAFLIKSLARFKEKYGKPFRMLMVGEGAQRAEYERLCRERGLAEEVIFTGEIPNREMGAYFAAADAFLFASKTETQGIVVLEAFAGGTPVIAVKASGVEDLVTGGVNGLLTKEDNEEYADALKNFLSRDFDRASMAKNAYLSGLKFREDAVAREAVQVYNRVMAENCAASYQYRPV
ncbi:MAG: glycosyltransferase [Roseburia sp.]|nr:glycosyltransferase [Roseburia sp.]MCM1098856.1 glycosyltransferase [Ruminococcus flavefaciens]